MKTESGFIRNGNADLYYETAGDGPPLVFLHAGVADSRQWDNEFTHFARDYCVVRYDRRGYGKSLPVEGQYTNMNDLIALLEALHLDGPLTMIGCSMGGMLALDFGIAYPGRVKALVMVGSAPTGLELDVPFDPREDEAEAANEAGDIDLATELEAQIFFDGMGRTPQQVNQDMRRLFLEMDHQAHSHAARNLGERLPSSNFVAVDRLDEINFPVLMVVGEHDEPYILQAADYMVDHVPSARKVLFKDAAHMLNMDHPEQFHITVRAFLNGATL